jgi:pentatricopeptide repeat protein
LLGVKGEKMPLRNVAPDKKTIKHATGCLRGKNWVKHADIIASYAKDGDQDTAKKMFDSIKKDEVKPDVFTYATMTFALLDGYAYSGKHRLCIFGQASIQDVECFERD